MPDLSQIVHGPALLPNADGTVTFHREIAIKCNARGRIDYVGGLAKLIRMPGTGRLPLRTVRGVIVPPFVDCHTHVPQHPIRGRFLAGVGGATPQGRLLAGLRRNVYPAEARFADAAYARDVAEAFAADTLRHGVVGGAAYVSSHLAATRATLEALPDAWHAGLVLMDQHCPPELRISIADAERAYRELAGAFGRRVIVTDRFAPVVSAPLRRAAAGWAGELGLRTQTHLNEQVGEKAHVERDLYPDAASYTDVYDRDRLLAHRPVLAHCVHQRPDEWDVLAARPGCVVAHCPTSNAALGSGVMPLAEVVRRRIPWVLCTDVGASPTQSLLAEMVQFLKAHAGRSAAATPSAALHACTRGAADVLGLGDRFGAIEVGKPLSYVEVVADRAALDSARDADDAIVRAVLRTTREALASGRDVYDALSTGTAGTDVVEAIGRDVAETGVRFGASVLSVTLAGERR